MSYKDSPIYKAVDSVYTAKPVAWVRDNLGARGSTPQERISTGVWGVGGSSVRVVRPGIGLADDAGRFIFQGTRKVPTQATDDVARAFVEGQGAKATTQPVAGRTFSQQFPTSFVVKSAVAAGGVAAFPYLAESFRQGSQAAGQAPVDLLKPTADAANDTLGDLFSTLTNGVANLLAGAGAGAGAGVGGAAYNALAGVGEGVKKAAVPLLLVGAGALIFFAVKDR